MNKIVVEDHTTPDGKANLALGQLSIYLGALGKSNSFP